MTETDPALGAGKSTLSQFTAKVLDQLSLSAWFPALLITCSLTLLLQFRSQQSMSLADALEAITDDWKQVLILAIPVLLLATVVTQSFSYGAIRFLEGYWNSLVPFGWLRPLMIRWQARRRKYVLKRRREAARTAFAVVRPVLLETYPGAVVNALEVQAVEGSVPKLQGDDARIYGLTTWRATCQAWDLAKVDRYDRARADYPRHAGRIMPTRLGNVQRAIEDDLENAGNDLVGFAMRRRSLVSSTVQMQHDQFRERLDMYCTLVFVSLVCAVLTAALLVGQIPRDSSAWVAALSAFFVGLSWTSYVSAIASARGYGATLKVMDVAKEQGN